MTMTSSKRWILVGVLTVLHVMWLFVIGGQYGPMLLFSSFFPAFVVLTVVSRNWLSSQGVIRHIAAGLVFGYAASIFSAVVLQLSLRGFSHLAFIGFSAHFYFYSAISLGWFFGGVTLPILAGATAARPESVR